DVDVPAQVLTVNVSLDTPAKGTLAGGGFSGSGPYTFSGTAAAATAAIRALVFTPTANRLAPGTSEVVSFQVIAADGYFATVSPFGGPRVGVSSPPLVTVAAVDVNGGAAQRSMVTSLTVNFSGRVTLPAAPAGAFQLVGPGGAVALTVDLSGSTATQTVARLTFSGPGIVGGSLADGSYTLTVLGSQVLDASGRLLDGDGNGVAGGDK